MRKDGTRFWASVVIDAIKDEDGKIKKFYKRMIIDARALVTSKLVLSQGFQDVLATAYKKYKEDVANHSDMSCPLAKENACENSTLTVAPGLDVTNHDEHQRLLNKCIVFISWHPNCLQRYETKDFIKPFLQDLADSGKIHGYVAPGQAPSLLKTLTEALQGSILGAPNQNSTSAPASDPFHPALFDKFGRKVTPDSSMVAEYLYRDGKRCICFSPRSCNFPDYPSRPSSVLLSNEHGSDEHDQACADFPFTTTRKMCDRLNVTMIPVIVSRVKQYSTIAKRYVPSVV